MNVTAHSITRMSLHRRGVDDCTEDKANDSRMLFAVCFYSEKWAYLCRGSPSFLSSKHEASEIAAGIIAMVSGSELRS